MVQVVITPVQNALPSYEIGGELGRGAMGIVLAGQHRQLDREVAIKQLPSAFAADEEVRHRFGQEARTLAALAHPHIVPVYDYVER
ncbi:MAG TPA: protein kinase, partial [Acidimicrobiia bacterium]|nr:protein kinase [Acidimicrobiia bacterium]